MTDQRRNAEDLAIQALHWLANDQDLIATFLGASGLSPAGLRSEARRPEFLASVLDFILMDDAWVIRFSDAAGLPYDATLAARRALPGGEPPHWT